MKAVLWTKYGDPDGLQLSDVEKPEPGDDDILVRIHAGSVTAGDCEMRRLQLPLMLGLPIRLYAGLFRPKRIPILGHEFAGEIVQIGSAVRGFHKGDRVFGTTGFQFGANAEYICLPAEPGDAQGAIALIPENTSFEQAAVLPTAGFEALHYIRSSGIGPGSRVLVVGGAGSIGTFSIQLARHHCAEVTAVDSTAKQDFMRRAGAHHTIDYTAVDYASDRPRGSYDLIIDVVGRQGVSSRLKLLKPDGLYFLAFAGLRHLLLSLWISMTSSKKLLIQASDQNRLDLDHLADLMKANILNSFIDHTYPLACLPEAHRHAESGRKLGNLAVAVSGQEEGSTSG